MPSSNLLLHTQSYLLSTYLCINYWYHLRHIKIIILPTTKYGLFLLQAFVRKNNHTNPPLFFNLFVYLLCFIINAKYIWHGILEGIDFAQFSFFFFVMMKFVLLLVIVVLISSNHKNTSSYVSNRGGSGGRQFRAGW